MWTSHDYSKCITYNFLFIAFINIIFLKMLVNFSTDMLFLNYNCTCLKWCTVYIISNIWFMYSLINFFTAICTWLKPAVGQWILLMFINFTHNDVIFQFVIFFQMPSNSLLSLLFCVFTGVVGINLFGICDLWLLLKYAIFCFVLGFNCYLWMCHISILIYCDSK